MLLIMCLQFLFINIYCCCLYQPVLWIRNIYVRIPIRGGIRASDQWIRILLFLSLTFETQTEIFFFSKLFYLPDPYLWLTGTDPTPGGPKTYGSGSPTLAPTYAAYRIPLINTALLRMQMCNIATADQCKVKRSKMITVTRTVYILLRMFKLKGRFSKQIKDAFHTVLSITYG